LRERQAVKNYPFMKGGDNMKMRNGERQPVQLFISADKVKPVVVAKCINEKRYIEIKFLAKTLKSCINMDTSHNSLNAVNGAAKVFLKQIENLDGTNELLQFSKK
jgi:hypothetical protein